LSGIVFKKEVIEKVFLEVVKMFRIEESETYKMIIEKGEKEEKIAIAKKLLKEGMDIERIAEITELSKEEIKKLMN
jgi:predicted transposase/invertase (TIGR01784 family)